MRTRRNIRGAKGKQTRPTCGQMETKTYMVTETDLNGGTRGESVTRQP